MTSRARDIFEKDSDKGSDYGCFYDYEPIVSFFFPGGQVVRVDDDDYQGDSRVLGKDKEGRYGWLQFGWGSCSGCDWLQSCDTYDDVDELIDHLDRNIKWFDSKDDALKFFNEHDWEGDYSYHYDKQKDFVASCIKELSK